MSYWLERAAETSLLNMEQKTEKVIESIAKLYKMANKGIEREIKGIITSYAQRESLDLEKAKEYINNSEHAKHIKKLEKAIDITKNPLEKERLRALYNSVSAKFRITRLEEKQNNINIELYKVANSEENISKKHYIDVINTESKRVIAQNLVAGAYSSISPKTIDRLLNTKWYGKNFSQRVWDNTDKLAKYLNRELKDSFIKGKNPNRLKSQMARAFKIKQYESSRLLRTESNYFHNQTTLETYKEEGLEEYKILAKLDFKTSVICRHQNGKKYFVKDAEVGDNYPPFHPFCRSTVIPIVKDFKPNIKV